MSYSYEVILESIESLIQQLEKLKKYYFDERKRNQYNINK